MSLFPHRGGMQAAASVPALLVELIARHPEPALLVSAGATLLAANAAARALLSADAGGTPAEGALWGDLIAWLGSEAAPAAPFHSTTVATGRGPVILDWTAAALADGMVAVFGRDVTLERALRAALTESRQRFRDFVDLACDFAWETGPDGRFAYVVPGEALGYAAEALVGRPADHLLAEPGVVRSPFEARRPVHRERLRLLRADGVAVEFILRARPLLDGAGAWCGVRGVGHRADLPAPDPLGSDPPEAGPPVADVPGADRIAGPEGR